VLLGQPQATRRVNSTRTQIGPQHWRPDPTDQQVVCRHLPAPGFVPSSTLRFP